MTAKKGQRLLHTRKVCIRGSDGTTKYLLGISEDITERKQAEEEIEILARFPFENPNPVLRIERDGKINYANPASESLLRFWNCTVGEYLPLDWRERVVNAVRYNTSTIVEVECEERFYSIMVVPILEAGYVNFYGRNITKRKQTEEALQESETRYRSVLQSATDAIVTVDSGGMVVGWNSAAERIFGYSYTEAVGQSLTSIMSFYPFDKHTNGMKGLQSEGGQNIIGKTVEFKGFRKDKSVFPIELSLSSWETKSEQFFTGIIRDITERKRAEAARQESELRFRSLYENTTVGLYRTTPDGNILLANPALVKMLGYTSFEKLAERNLEKDGFESSSQRKEFIEKIERDGEVIGHDSKWVRQDGAAIFVVESARAIRDSQGKTMYYDGTVEDITEHKRAEDTVRESKEKFRIMFV
jgi:PAS domain S-box-containing protein